MGWLIATLIGIATIYFMIISRGFRIAAVIAVGATVLSTYYWIDNSTKQAAQYNGAQAKAEAERQNERRTAVKTTNLVLQDVSLKRNYDSWWTLEGVVANKSNRPLESLRFTVTMLDCPPLQECRIIGQESVDTMTMDVPAGQTRAFSTYALDFKNMPSAANKRWRYQLIEVGTGCDDECWAAASQWMTIRN